MNEFETRTQRYSQQSDWQGLGTLQPQTAAQASVAERMSFIRKVYGLFFIATLFAVGGVALGFLFPPLMIAAFEHPWIALIVMLGGVMGAQALRHQPGINLLALFGFTTLTGVVISPLLYLISRDNPASILQAGVLTVGIFGGLTAYAFI